MESPTGGAMRFERGSSAAAKAAKAAAGGERKRLPSVTLKLAMDRNGAVDDMSDGPKRFTSQESLDAGERAWQPRDGRSCWSAGGGAVRDGYDSWLASFPDCCLSRAPEGEKNQKIFA